MKLSNGPIPGPGRASIRELKYQSVLNRDFSETGFPLRPNFQWMAIPGQPRQIQIRPGPSGTAERLLRIPFRYQQTDGNRSRPMCLQSGACILNLNTNAISPVVAGIVDGIGLTANGQYLLCGFADKSLPDGSQFIGYGLVHSPIATATSAVAYPLGALATFSLTGAGLNNGLRFSVGARVIIRASTALGTNYNQGTITAKSQISLTVQLDTTYGALSETNTSLAIGNYTCLQVDSFQPLDLTGAPIGGYEFSILGSISTDSGSDILDNRTIGDPVRFAPILAFQQTTGVTTNYQLCLARWLPFHAYRCYATLEMSTSNNGSMSVGMDLASILSERLATMNSAATEQNRGSVQPLTRQRDNSISLQLLRQGGSVTGRFFLYGYEGENEF